MLKNKKFYLGLSSLSAVSIIATAISCVNTVDAYDNGANVSEIKKTQILDGSQLTTAQKELKTVLITDEGSVEDKSFNESALEGSVTLIRQLGLKTGPKGNFQFIKPAGKVERDYHAAYDVAFDNGFTQFLLPGYKHNEKIKSWWAEKEKAALKDEKIKAKLAKLVVIGLDFAPSQDQIVITNKETNTTKTLKGIPVGHAIDLSYNVEQAAFVVGRAVAQYLKETQTDKAKRVISTFGGATSPGVTDFIRGLIAGVHSWNQDNVDADKVSLSSGIVLDSTFETSNALFTAAIQQLTNNANTALFPVAGPATFNALSSIKNHQFIIGVDTNGAIVEKEHEGKFFSSVLKQVGQSVYSILEDLYTGQNKYLKQFALGKKSDAISGTISNNLVGSAASTISTEKEKANAALTAAQTWFDNTANKSTYTTLVGTAWSLDSALEKAKQAITAANAAVKATAVVTPAPTETAK